MCFLHKVINSFSQSPVFLFRRDPAGHLLTDASGTKSHIPVTCPSAAPRAHLTVLGVHIFVFLLHVVFLMHRLGLGGHSI